MPKPNFPGPYVNSVPSEADPMVKVVDQTQTEIGARKASGLPKDIASESMTLEHVGKVAR